MRQLKRISFLLYSCLLLGMGFYGHIRYLEFFYPGNRSQKETAGILSAQEDVSEASVRPAQITRDTLFIIQSYDLGTGEMSREEERAQERYVGMEREEFVRCIEDMETAPLLKERQSGLSSVEVLSFSPERVIIKKTYQKGEKQADFFWLFYRDNRVVVYREDKSSVYMQTVVDGRTLPAGVRDEITYGKVIASRQELEQFLEAYSQYRAE